jgi:hypothetical protein
MSEEVSRARSRDKFRTQLLNPLRFKAFLFLKMPIALLAGLYIRKFDDLETVVSVPFKWLSQNPFRSVYFATQAMAAEMSTGLPAMAAIQGYKPAVSMLVTNLEAEFVKKASERVFFTCNDQQGLTECVEKAVASGEGRTYKATSVGQLKDGTVVSTFTITWSFKQKTARK